MLVRLRLYPLNLMQLVLTQKKVDDSLISVSLKYIFLVHMEITYNNRTQEVSIETLVSDFVFSQVGEKQKGIAVAINETIVAKSEWARTYLKSNDNLLIIKATQGG